MTYIIPLEDVAYFDALLARRGSAVRLDPRAVRFLDGSAPEPSKCHENADRWVRENPACSVVRGWALEIDSPECSLFVAHSVVDMGDGLLVDITLARSLPFLAHEGEAGQFDRLKLRHAQQFWPLPPSNLAIPEPPTSGPRGPRPF